MKKIINWLGKNNKSNGFQVFDHLVRSFNYMLNKDISKLFGEEALVWVTDTPNRPGGDRGGL